MLADPISLALFLKVVESKSISKGAIASHIVLSAASRRITQLEKQFDAQLLHRLKGGVVPTLAGEALAQHARRVLGALGQLSAEMSDFASGSKGRVRLYANSSIMQQSLPELLASFRDAKPDIEVDIREAGSASIIRAVQERAADVGIVTSGIPLEGLDSETLCPDPLCVVVPTDHPLKGPSVHFSELVGYSFVGLDGSAALMQLLADAAADSGHVLNVSVQVRSFESVCRMIQAGIGIGVVPEGAVKVFQHSLSLRLIRLNESWARRTMLICTKKEALSLPARMLVKHLVGSPLR
ncbi:LysR family transcriptional regulator [Polaromonas sp. OV174]|uniref:LysR family transcriptional regulator n=1 Tax=Polaromonas sp. OV174 TaxID=1855300 RepID=UPI0015A68E79|nr:LysR family transcriptional regulator [Polaromonas sp. OV174]